MVEDIVSLLPFFYLSPNRQFFGRIEHMKLCSACLLGIKCRYDGKSNLNEKVITLSKKETLLPVCPEILGGLPTPREQAEIKGSKVITKTGKDVTTYFKKGSEQVLKLAKSLEIKEAILSQRSPSCGCGEICDGTFSNKLIEGDGVTTSLLKRNKIKVIPDNKI